jgi:hypothetical protein
MNIMKPTFLLLTIYMAFCTGCVHMKDTKYPMQKSEIEFYNSLNEPGFQIDSIRRTVYKAVWSKDHDYNLGLYTIASDSISANLLNEKADQIARFVSKIAINDKYVVSRIGISISRLSKDGGTDPIGMFSYEIKKCRNDRLWKLIQDN